WASRYGSLTELAKEGVAKFGDREMWYFPDFDIRWTYNEFDEAVNNVAYGLHETYGIRKGDRVAIMATNIPEAFVSYLALSQIGAISVIINARLAAEEAERQFEDSGCAAAIIEGALWERMKTIAGRLPALQNIFVTGAEGGEGAIPFSKLMERKAPREVLVDVSERDICSLIYTSGTTGRPKGTITLHRGVVNNAMNGISLMDGVYDTGDKPEDIKQLIITPFFHVTTLHTLINNALLGSTSVVLSTFKADQAIDVMIDERIASLPIVTAMYWLFKLQPRYPELVKTGVLRYISQGGSPMAPEMCTQLAGEFPDAKIANGYGFTEGASIGWLLLMAGGWDAMLAKPGTVGGTLGNSRVRIVDDQMRDVPRGEPGEILSSSPGISPGYWNLPEETAAAFFVEEDERRWFRSGDIGYMDEDGYTFIVDRIKSMICRGGENVYCVELENLLSQHPKVMEAGVVGVPDNVLGEKIKAVLWPMPGEKLTVEEVKEFCKGRIADYKVPDYVVFTELPLPRNPGGKILKAELKDKE
ncbi:MAG: class I adenylate-forming enzyme family protein, partial [Thermodesulfobacteriota bacterium]